MSLTRVEGSAYKVEFVDVGRGKRCWTTNVAQLPTEPVLERMVRKSGALASSDIECVFDDDDEHGVVYVGGLRPVGAFRVTHITDEERSHGA